MFKPRKLRRVTATSLAASLVEVVEVCEHFTQHHTPSELFSKIRVLFFLTKIRVLSDVVWTMAFPRLLISTY